jgi:hypothetical protein
LGELPVLEVATLVEASVELEPVVVGAMTPLVTLNEDQPTCVSEKYQGMAMEAGLANFLQQEVLGSQLAFDQAHETHPERCHCWQGC